jgi:hypothetical protein
MADSGDVVCPLKVKVKVPKLTVPLVLSVTSTV